MGSDTPRRGPVPPVFFLLAICAAIAAHRFLPVLQIIPRPWHYGGALLIVIGVAMAAISAGAFRRAGTPVVPFTQSTSLVTSGFYRYTRNPMYLGMVVALLGIDVMLGSLAPFLVTPVFALIIHRRFILREEAMLEGIFGDEYLAFKQRIPRWL